MCPERGKYQYMTKFELEECLDILPKIVLANSYFYFDSTYICSDVFFVMYLCRMWQHIKPRLWLYKNPGLLPKSHDVRFARRDYIIGLNATCATRPYMTAICLRQTNLPSASNESLAGSFKPRRLQRDVDVQGRTGFVDEKTWVAKMEDPGCLQVPDKFHVRDGAATRASVGLLPRRRECSLSCNVTLPDCVLYYGMQ